MPYKNRTFICAGCLCEFTKPAPANIKYCSLSCYRADRSNGAWYTATCEWCGDEYLARHIWQGRKYCSRACYFTAPMSDENRKKRSNPGEKHWNWKGGVMKGRKDRNLAIYKEWRLAVFARDEYTCQWCGLKNKKGLGTSIKLEADHIKSWADYPKLRYEVSNGRTLCKACHTKRTAQQHIERMSHAI